MCNENTGFFGFRKSHTFTTMLPIHSSSFRKLPTKCKSHVKFQTIFKLIAICEIRKTLASENLRNYTHLACDFM